MVKRKVEISVDEWLSQRVPVVDAESDRTTATISGPAQEPSPTAHGVPGGGRVEVSASVLAEVATGVPVEVAASGAVEVAASPTSEVATVTESEAHAWFWSLLEQAGYEHV